VIADRLPQLRQRLPDVMDALQRHIRACNQHWAPYLISLKMSICHQFLTSTPYSQKINDVISILIESLAYYDSVEACSFS
jgi:hypothetical protein